MASRFVPFVFFVLASVAVAALAVACNGQGEGDLCDLRNGDNDCQNGFKCSSPQPGFFGNRCCPADPALAKVNACKVGTTGVNSSPSPPDAGADAGATARS
jgi:hypothetical protein